MRRKRVAVLGAGPAGLLAAHAAARQGHDVTVFSRPDATGGAAKSQLWGCQYLHRDIPGLRGGVGRSVRYMLDGSPSDYRAKVYGGDWSGNVSPDEYGPEQDHHAWDLRAAYEDLWAAWLPCIIPVAVDEHALAAILHDKFWRFVICTIPAPQLCRRPDTHKFASRDVYAMGSAPGNALPFTPPPFTVQCNAHDGPRWYRAANVYGYSTIEWPDGPRPPINGVVRVSKPLSTDCDCWVTNKRFVRMGRYGQWAKGVLAHESYYATESILP